MPTGCGVPLCPNRSPGSRQLRERGRVIGYHILPRDELRRAEWCRRIGRKDPGQVELRVCSDHYDGDRDYRRVGSVLRDAGQTMKDVRLKPETVPSLRLPLTGKPPFSSAEDPASKRQRTLDDDPVEEMDCFVDQTDQTPREQMPREGRCHCRHRASTSDAALQVDPPTARDAAVQVARPTTRDAAVQVEPGPTPRPPVTKDRSTRTDPKLGKRSFGTQVNFYAKGVTGHWVQTEGSELAPGSSSTAGSSGHSTSNHATITTTTPVPPLNPALAPAMSPHASDSEEEEEEED
ncbi:uncharacterized protein LOC115308964, partial [Ixodes scapularis]|uniref:uncharacterized protein LOC115308964 n=1 Tax=Ixodes scapularis TaxID=6945 RepID=UPI001A9EC7BE